MRAAEACARVHAQQRPGQRQRLTITWLLNGVVLGLCCHEGGSQSANRIGHDGAGTTQPDGMWAPASAALTIPLGPPPLSRMNAPDRMDAVRVPEGRAK